MIFRSEVEANLHIGEMQKATKMEMQRETVACGPPCGLIRYPMNACCCVCADGGASEPRACGSMCEWRPCRVWAAREAPSSSRRRGCCERRASPSSWCALRFALSPPLDRMSAVAGLTSLNGLTGAKPSSVIPPRAPRSLPVPTHATQTTARITTREPLDSPAVARALAVAPKPVFLWS